MGYVEGQYHLLRLLEESDGTTGEAGKGCASNPYTVSDDTGPVD
jgi:hypothetical protein